MIRCSALAAAALTASLFGQTVNSPHSDFFPVRSIRAGMHGVGKTVFSGNRIDDFDVEILGVLENVGPKQSLILAKLSGGPLAQTGVLQGMSGSPVYIEGKIVGAVALAFPFSKEPIAAIRPIEEMVRVSDVAQARDLRASAQHLSDRDLTSWFQKSETASFGGSNMIDIATPLTFGGFTSAAIDHFAPQLRSLGLDPRQGVSLGGRVDERMGNPSALKPGSMISVELMTGDLSVGADGTVTYIDGARIYAFGHRFLSVGPTGLPFARAEVMTLLPNLNSSFKISAPKELMGVISQDRNTAIAGLVGKRAEMVPVDIAVARNGQKMDNYKVQMVNDRFLSPFLLQMAVFSAVDATERTVGASSLAVKGEIQFEGKRKPIALDNIFSGDNGSALQLSLSAAIPLAYVMQGGFDSLKVKKVALEIESYDTHKALQIDQVYVSRREVHAGDPVDLTVQFAGDNGMELSRTVRYQVPVGASPGTLYFTVADGMVTSIADLRQSFGSQPRSADQLISTANRLRPNSKAYVRVWRADPDYQVEGEDLPEVPPSAAFILGAAPSIAQSRNSKIGELAIDAGEVMVSGSKTVQIEVKE